MTLRDAFASKVAIALLYGAVMTGTAVAQDSAVSPSSPAQSSSLIQTTKTQAASASPALVTTGTAIDPLIPLPVTGGLAAAFALVCLWSAKRNTRGTLPRLAAGAIVVTALINPQKIVELREVIPTDVVIAVDKTASQSIGERHQDTDKAQAELVKNLSALGNINIRTVEIGAGKDKIATDGTNIFTTLQESLSDIPRERLGGVFVITDGQVHDVPNNRQMLGANVPVHGLITGKPDEFDRRIVIDSTPRYGLVNKDQSVTFRVIDDGAAPQAGKVRVTVAVDGRELPAQFVTVGEKTELKIGITHIGANTIEIKTDPVAGELTADNNRTATSIEGIRESLNVLVVSGLPNAGLRMWRDLFKSDPDNTLIHFTRVRTPSNLDDTPLTDMALIPAPMDELFERKIDKFDLVVLDNVPSVGMLLSPYFESIRQYVSKGGSLLVLNGADYAGPTSLYNTALKPVLPAAPDGKATDQAYVPKVTAKGERHPVTRALDQSLPWGQWYSTVGSESVTGDVIMEGSDKKPLLILDHKDKGRVAMLMSDNAWLWANGHNGGGPSVELLQKISHWLMRNPAMEEEALRLRPDDGKIVLEQQTMGDKPSPVVLKTPSGARLAAVFESAGSGLWRAHLPANEMGLYSAEQSGSHPLRSFISIGSSNPKEFSGLVSTPSILTPVALDTGGKVMRLHDAGGAFVIPSIRAVQPEGKNQILGGEGWMGIRLTEASLLKGVDRTPYLPAWAAILMSLGFLGAAFYREGEGKLFSRKGPSGSDRKGPVI